MKKTKLILLFVALMGAVCAGCASSGAENSAKAGVGPQSDFIVPALPTAAEEAAFSEKVERRYSPISIKVFSDGFNHARYQYPGSIPPWELYDTDQIAGFAENMVYLQNPDGGWAKNLDLQRKFSLEELMELQIKNQEILPVTWHKKTQENGSTVDNRNIFSQIQYLAQVYAQIPDERYMNCMLKAIQWILNAQHPASGGFTGADVEAITYNDDVMALALKMLKEIHENDVLYGIVPEKMRNKARKAYEKGIQCILKTQITLTLEDGSKILTAWCQQHSYTTLQPIWAREFEPPSVCTTESAKILELLMGEENPTPAIKKSIIAACTWLNSDAIRIKGKKIQVVSAPGEVLNGRYYDFEKIMVDDPSDEGLWARFYALDSSFDVTVGARKPIKGTYPAVNQPVWCDRGCKYCPTFNDISKERRNGYGYTTRVPSVLKKYESWKKKHKIEA